MTPTDAEGERGLGAWEYTLLAFAGLLMVTVLLVQEGLGAWAVLPLAAGAAGVLVPGMIGPALVLLLILLVLALKSVFAPMPLGFRPASPLMDMLLAMATLVYVAGHTRLLTIRRHTLPPDPRRERRPQSGRARGRWFLPQEAVRRTAGRLAQGEFLALGAVAPVFALLAYIVWVQVALTPMPLDMTGELSLQVWRALLVVWVAGLALLLGWVVFAYFGRALAGREESLLYLQDQVWAETRREQRRINGWLTWARLLRQRKEERR